MAVICFVVSSFVSMIVAVLCYAFTSLGLLDAAMIYLGGGIVLGTALSLIGHGLVGRMPYPGALASDHS